MVRRVGSLQPEGAHFTLDTNPELAAGSVVCLVIGSIADHVLSFGELRSRLWTPQRHSALNRWVLC